MRHAFVRNYLTNWRERFVSDSFWWRLLHFLKFANFYKRFIFGYSRITISLIKLTRIIDTSAIFSWNSDDFEKNAFQTLKLIFIIALILIHFDFDKKTWIEIDASNYVVTTILSQKEKNDQLHLVAFMSKKMSLAECNYEIYNKKLLIIIRIFEEWKSECVDTSINNSIRIFTDHKNLEHFMTIKQLNRRQARWVEFLSKFNFQIIYRFDVQSIKSDNLIRRFENFFKDALNDRIKYNFQILLKRKNLKQEIRNVINLISDLMNERQMNVARLTCMMYELIEKNVLDVEKSIKESTSNILETDSINEKSSEKSDTEQLINLIVIMKRIKTAYLENEILQQLMNVKRIDKRKISSALYKKNIKLKLSHCKIQNDLFWIKNRMYVSANEVLQIDIIKITHELKSIDHAERSTTYDRINRHYYWFKMYASVQQYIKTCHACKKIKHYRDAKQELLNFLSISKNYFQNISIGFNYISTHMQTLWIKLRAYHDCNKQIIQEETLHISAFSKREYDNSSIHRMNMKEEKLFVHCDVWSRNSIHFSLLTEIMWKNKY